MFAPASQASLPIGRTRVCQARSRSSSWPLCQTPASLAALTQGCKSGANLLALAVEAARHDATLGEISSAMEEVFGRHDATPAPVTGVYKSAYEFDRRWAQVRIDMVGVRIGRQARPEILHLRGIG